MDQNLNDQDQNEQTFDNQTLNDQALESQVQEEQTLDDQDLTNQSTNHDSTNMESLAYLEKDSANRLAEFLVYSGIKDAICDYNKISNTYEVKVKSQSFAKAKELYEVFSENEFDDAEEIPDLEHESVGSLYSDTTEKYKDYISSAYTFFVCGLAGLIIVILNDLNVIHLFSHTGITFIIINVVLGGLFFVFLIIAVLSFRSSKVIKVQADHEKEVKEKIFSWLKENVTQDMIESSYDNSIPEEMKYFNRQSFIKQKLTGHYDDLSEEMLEFLTDSYIEQTYHTEK